MYPASRRPSRNAVALNEYVASDALFRNPTTGLDRACPRAIDPRKAGEAPSAIKKLRRFILVSPTTRVPFMTITSLTCSTSDCGIATHDCRTAPSKPEPVL